MALDPPATDSQAALIDERFTVAWGDPEAQYALAAHEAGYDLRPAAAAVYRALRDGALPDAVAAAPSPAAAGRALRVLAELGPRAHRRRGGEAAARAPHRARQLSGLPRLHHAPGRGPRAPGRAAAGGAGGLVVRSGASRRELRGITPGFR